MKQLYLLVSISVLMAETKPVPLPSFYAKAKELLARMTLDEKVGQMTQPDQMYLKDPSDIETYFLGSVLSGGDSDPKAGNGREAWTNLATSIEAHATKTRLKIPLLYGIDAVHGHNNVLGAVSALPPRARKSPCRGGISIRNGRLAACWTTPRPGWRIIVKC